MPLASSGFIPVWGVVRHRGRRSGRAFATPVALGATADSFIVPLPYGEGTDWCRNLFAAGVGSIRYRGRDYPVSDPQLVGIEVARPAFPAVLRPLLSVMRLDRYLRVRRAAS